MYVQCFVSHYSARTYKAASDKSNTTSWVDQAVFFLVNFSMN